MAGERLWPTGKPSTPARTTAALAVGRRPPAAPLAGSVVAGHVLLELRVRRGERVLAAGPRLDHEEEIVRPGRARRGLDRGEARVADRPGREARVLAGVVRGRVLELR